MALQEPTPEEGLTHIQKLVPLVEWFLTFNDVICKFVPNRWRAGRYIPEFDVEYWLSGRRIGEKGLAMTIEAELAKRNYNYSLGKVTGALVEITWRMYVLQQEYPDWLVTDPPPLRRAVGRPRKHMEAVTFDPKPPARRRMNEHIPSEPKDYATVVNNINSDQET